jgi:hypothetical protein
MLVALCAASGDNRVEWLATIVLARFRDPSASTNSHIAAHQELDAGNG